MLDQKNIAPQLAMQKLAMLKLAKRQKQPNSASLSLLLTATLAIGSSGLPLSPATAQYQPQDAPRPQQQVGANLNQPRFRCNFVNDRPTVMYYPDGRAQGFAWATPGTMGGGWSAERRCFEISRRLEQYRPDGLVEMRTGIENSQNVVCATTDRVPSCRIIFTVPPGQDPVVTRDRVFQNLLVADRGDNTQPVATFAPTGRGGVRDWLNQGIMVLGGEQPSVGGGRGINPYRNSGINLKPFLAPADGGTGAGINSGATGRPFNPNIWR